MITLIRICGLVVQNCKHTALLRISICDSVASALGVAGANAARPYEQIYCIFSRTNSGSLEPLLGLQVADLKKDVTKASSSEKYDLVVAKNPRFHQKWPC